MLRFIVRRLLQLVPILFGVSILVFFWIRSLPGGPEQALLRETATPAQIAAVRLRYHLDDPVYLQYWNYLKQLLGGDLGTSIISQRTVTWEFGQRFPATVELALAAMLFAVCLGIPLGFMAAKRYGTWFDGTSLVGSLIGVSIPIFFLGLMLKYLFAVKLHWLPSIGREDVLAERNHPTNFYLLDAIIERDPEAFWDSLKHLILPAICLGTIPLAVTTRITRAATLDVQNEDYVRTARAKGMSPRIVDRRHVLRNALLPVSTIIGLQTGLLLSGAVLTETVFSWPGVGSWLGSPETGAIFRRDYPVIQGGILFLALIFVFVNLLVDISYAIINPRIRLSSIRRPRERHYVPHRDAPCVLVSHHCSHPSQRGESQDRHLVSLSEIEVAGLERAGLEGSGSGGLWSEAFRRVRKNKGAVVGMCIVSFFVIIAIFAPLLAKYSPTEPNPLLFIKGCCTPPNSQHWFGADNVGRDEFARIVYGARYSLIIGFAAVFCGLSIGLPLGSIAGYFGGWIDTLVMRVMDVMLAIPGLLLAIGIVAMLGPGLKQVTIAVGITNVPIFARLLRGSVLAQRETDFVLAARSVGVKKRVILFSHIVPNAISPVIVQGTLAMATAIIDVAGLGFLGLASQDPNLAEWGTMLNDVERYLSSAPYLAFFPGFAIVLLVLGFNLIGDGLREAFDPKLRGRV